MPILAGDISGFFVRLDEQDFRVIRHKIRRRRVHVQSAEAAAEIHLLLDAQLLVSEENDEAVHERVMHLLELAVVQRPRQVDAENLCADARRRLAYVDGLVGHALSSNYFASMLGIPPRRQTLSLSMDARSLDYRPPLVDLGLLQCAQRFRGLLVARWN